MSYDDRRQHPRRAFAGRTEYQGSPGVTGAMITEIGAGGVRAITNGPARPGQRVTLRLIPDGRGGEFIDLTGQVVWARQVPPFCVGIQFIEQTEDQRRKLVDLLG